MKYYFTIILAFAALIQSWAFAQTTTNTTTVTVQWDQSPEDPTEIGYRFYYYNVATPATVQTIETTNLTTSFVAIPGQTYSMYVTAYWLSIALESVPSAILTYRTPDVVVPVPVIAAPSSVNLVSISYSGNLYSSQFTFLAPGTNITSFSAYVWTDQWTNTISGLVNRSFTLARLTNDVPYKLAVSSHGANGAFALGPTLPLLHKVSTNWNSNVRTKVATISSFAP